VKPLPILDFNVSSVNINPYYNNKTLADNFAVITLSSVVPLGKYPHISIACLPEDDIMDSNINCLVAGWGRESKVSDDNFVLKDVDQPLLNGTYCQNVLRTSVLGSSFELDTYSWICAGGEANKSNCDGDGGNPLVCNITGQWYVVGLASWGPMDQCE
jgi:secreted trypsin-like serine protease